MSERAPHADDLQAYVDGAIDADRMAAVERWLEREPEAAAEVQAYRQQRALLHAAFDPVLSERVPSRLTSRPRAARLSLRVAHAFTWLVTGALLGWFARETDTTAPLEALPRQALVAHAAFVPEVRHPVEVAASEEAHLVAWLSKRLGKPIHAPALGAYGFELLGGRLLPESGRPGAQFMYEDRAGRRLTLYVSTDVSNHDSAFRYTTEGPLHVFYWIDRDLGYALSGELDKQEMLRLARAVHAELGR